MCIPKGFPKFFSLLCVLSLNLLPCVFAGSAVLPADAASLPVRQIESARAVIERCVPDIAKRPASLQLQLCAKQGACDVYEYSLKQGVLHVRGSSPVALCRGFYDYFKTAGLGMIGWGHKRVSWPRELPQVADKRVESPVRHHYYLNVVTYGYSMPFWDWSRWQQELDWMALHGFDMPLFNLAAEAVAARVWQQLGLEQQEIDNFNVGPAYLPWLRMGNITKHEGGLSANWHKSQLALAHQVLDRMRSLGMKPICPAFAGFVPKSLQRVFPQIKLHRLGWGGWPEEYAAHMLEPTSELFAKIGSMHIKAWEQEFGKCQYYLADAFNEMQLPAGQEQKSRLLQDVGAAIYKSISETGNGATWVMQGWMLGYQRDIWNAKSLADLLQKVPQDGVLILDLAADYNKYFWRNGMNWDVFDAFVQRPWVYSVVPNMGGKSGMTGVLEFYANGHLEALNSPKRGKLCGIGMAPEGIENNELLYELLSDAGWSSAKINLQEWLSGYFKARYGSCPAGLLQAMQGLQNTCYASLYDHPRFNWQLAPGTRNNSMLDNELFEQALRDFVMVEGLEDSRLFEQDAIEMSVHLLGIRMSRAIKLMLQSLDDGDFETAKQAFEVFKSYGMQADNLLLAHPVWRLERWLDFARNSATDAEEQQRYMANAKRLVTLWGPPIDDYSARLWSGLIRDYYIPRWQHYLQANIQGQKPDMHGWELAWLNSKQNTSPEQPRQVLQLCRQIVASPQHALLAAGKRQNAEVIGNWRANELEADWKELRWKISAADLAKMKALRFTYTSGKHALEIKQLSLHADGKVLMESCALRRVGLQPRAAVYAIDLAPNIQANNGCEIRALVKPVGGSDSNGKLEIISK